MSSSTRRRPRGSVEGKHALYAKVDPGAAKLVQECAERLGVSNGEFVELALLHVGDELDADGVPRWWTKPVPAPEELPLTG